MICQKCGTQVDNDLIFCTNCGERLFQPNEEAQTVVMNRPVATQAGAPAATQAVETPKKGRLWIWLLAIIGLLALAFAGAAAVFMFMLKPKPAPVANAKTSPTPAATAKKTPPNKNTAVNTVKTPEENTNTVADPPEDESTEVVNDRINIDVDEHYAVPFEVKNDGTKIIGSVRATVGEGVLGFVYTQEAYDEFFPNEIHKVFSFEGIKSAEIEQTLVKGNYVIVFVNDTDKPLAVAADVSLEKQ